MTDIIDAKARKLAIQANQSYLVQAPAGSGKTELLIQRILTLLAIVEQPEEILALTFTRKAAAEMRERVLLALQQASQPKPQQQHAQHTWHLAKKVLQQSTIKHWRLTKNPARLRIMTIDAFASGLVRQLPVLSGFGQTPNTVDFTEPLYQSAINDLVRYAQQQHAPQPLQQAINTLILHMDCNMAKLNQLLCGMLSCREQWLPDVLKHSTNMPNFKNSLETSLHTVIEHTLQETYNLIPDNIRGTLPKLIRFAEAQLSQTHASDTHLLSPLKDIAIFPKPKVENILQWQSIVALLLTSGSKADFRKTVNKNQGFPTGDSYKPHKKNMVETLNHLQGNTQLLQQLLQVRFLPRSATFNDCDWYILESLFIVLKKLAGQLWLTFEQHKKVDFIEVMLRAKQALGYTDAQENIMPSDALLRLDHQIKHILVDEFQDTSTLQIDLLSYLTAGWEQDGRTFFMVGDPMQSIYRFRKAEVSLFLRAARNELALPIVTSLKLEQNFRSSPDIVQWVNHAFSNILPKKNDVLAGAITYTPSEAFKQDAGNVTLHVFRQRQDQDEANQIVALIKENKLQGKKTGILARSRSHLHILMHSLQDHHVSFRALDILPLHGQPEIIDLRSLTSVLIHPCDQVAWASLLRTPTVGLPLSALQHICNHQAITPWLAIQAYATQVENLEDKRALQHLVATLTPALQQVRRTALRPLVESVWLNLATPSTLSATQLGNCDVFLNLLEEIESEGAVDIELLDQRLAKLFARPESNPHAEQVELLTMHSAKGLQWDTVILIGLGKKPRTNDKEVLVQTETNTHEGQQLLLAPLPHGKESQTYNLIRNFEQQRDTLETARLLYVACTRAECNLHLFGHISEKHEQPAATSLLALLWQDLEQCYGATMKVYDTIAALSHSASDTIQNSYRRITNYSPPTPQQAIACTTANKIDIINTKPAFSWAGASARAVGIALHAALQTLADIGIEHWQEHHNQQAMISMRTILLREGISQNHVDQTLQRSFQGLLNCQQSSKARWILSNKHQQQHNEWALTYVEGGQCKHLVLDRSFIDPDGIRWVIDYKTGIHEGADVEAFLDQELLRYTEETPQLPNYVKALKALEPTRTIKAALYFPMIDGWRVWKMD